MTRRHRRSIEIEAELETLEQELIALTLRVAELRFQSSDIPERNGRVIDATPTVGDRVSFRILGRSGLAEGVVIGLTTQRIRIKQDLTGYIYLRAAHNVTLL